MHMSRTFSFFALTHILQDDSDDDVQDDTETASGKASQVRHID